MILEPVYAVLAVLVIFAVVTFVRGGNLRDVKRGDVQRGIITVLALAGVIVAISLLVGCGVHNPRIYLGLDTMKKTSPQCKEGGGDTHTTSNVGVVATIYDRPTYDVEGVITHHSCAFSGDRNSYNGIGLRVNIKLKPLRHAGYAQAGVAGGN